MSVSLSKGQRISLSKDANGGAALSKINIGLGWDIDPAAGTVDLDANATLLGAAPEKKILDEIYFSNKTGKGVKHSGDNRTGAGDGDDETIEVDLNALDAAVQNVVFSVCSYSGQKFDVVKNATVRVYVPGGNELCKFKLDVKMPHTALIVARLYRHNGDWKFAALGEAADGATVKKLGDKIKTLV